MACPAVASAEGVRKAAASLALAGVLAFGDVSEASARVVEPYAGLTPCGAWAVLGEGQAAVREQADAVQRLAALVSGAASDAAGESSAPRRERGPAGREVD